jgi:cell wall-associated NlpC family hydrolase
VARELLVVFAATTTLGQTTPPAKETTTASKAKSTATPKAKSGAAKSKSATAKAKPAAPSPVDNEAKTSAPSSDSPSISPTADEPEIPQPNPDNKKKLAAVSSLLPEEIEGFESYPEALQTILRKALALTTQNLRYQFGSSDPKEGGMDCSGTMFRVLTDSGLKDVPRQSDEFCRWVMRKTLLYRTEDVSSLKDPALSALKPGDLLFWTGTYETGAARELPISHVMIYLGKRKKDGKPVVFGSSDGRSYDNQRRNGVSVFDFALPRRGNKSEFYGYGPVPGVHSASGS